MHIDMGQSLNMRFYVSRMIFFENEIYLLIKKNRLQEKCYPENIDIKDGTVRINLQSILDHTAVEF